MDSTAQLKKAKERGERTANTDLKNKIPFIRVDYLNGVINNPYQWRVGNFGKKLKAAWHNGYRDQFNSLA